MTKDEQNDLVILGKLQAIHSAMNVELPKEEEVRANFFAAKKLFFKALDMHWDKCNSMLSKKIVGKK